MSASVKPAGRVLLLLLLSIGLGAAFGLVCSLVMLPEMAFLGLVFGAFVGLLLSPLLALLWRKDLDVALPIVIVPTFVAAFACGYLKNPLTAMLLSGAVYVATILGCRVRMNNVFPPPPPGQCKTCGYNASGLGACPECGQRKT